MKKIGRPKITRIITRENEYFKLKNLNSGDILGEKKTKEQIKAKWKEVCHGSPDLIYRNGCSLFNYSGKLRDDPEMLYIEYVSKLASEDFHILERIGKNPVGLRDLKSFNNKHNGITNTRNREKKYGEINFNEKSFAIALFNSGYDFSFGKIFEYELPMGEKQESNIGEIDLLSVLDNEVYVIELKIGQNESGKKTGETLLRALMEAFTFIKLLNYRKDKFIKDMGHKFITNEEFSKKVQFRPAVLTLTNALCDDHMQGLQKGQLHFLKLLIITMNNHLTGLGILPFKFFAIDAENPELKKDDNGRIVLKDQNFTASSKVLEYSYI